MDENPYKAPDVIASGRARNLERHPMIDPLWQRTAWVVLLLPFLIEIAIVVARSLVR